jgi:hypothetical protein
MYQFSHDVHPGPRHAGLAYLESCTTIAPTREHAGLITTLAALLRAALDSTDAGPLQQFVSVARDHGNDIDEIIGAAGHIVIDDLMRTDAPATRLAAAFAQLGAIERKLFSFYGAPGSLAQ